MNRRRGSLGWIVAGLGLLLCICLLPYLISSVYSVASTLFHVDAATQWLWGDWLSTVIDPGGAAYRLVVEAPVCCGGAVGLLITVLGIVWLMGGRGDEDSRPEEEPFEGELLEDEAAEHREEPIVPDIDRATW
jgi:hypothetical protein